MHLINWLISLGGQPLYCAIYGRDKDITFAIKLVRKICNFFIGVLLAYLLWNLFGIDKLSGNWQVEIFTVIILGVGLAYMLSIEMRAITLLIFAGMTGQIGRRYLRGLAFALVIAGPIHNLVRNAGEVARVFSCTTMLTYNLTKTRFDLMAKPFTNTLQNMKDELDEIQHNFQELQDILADLKFGVEYTNIEDDKFGNNKRRRAANVSHLQRASKVHGQFTRNMRNRCKHQLRSGHRVCEEIFLQGYRKCTTNFPDWMASVICWPYRVDMLCEINMFGNPDKVCDATKVVPSDFGSTYVKLLVAEHELFDNSSTVEITYQMQNLTTSEQVLSAKQTSERFMKDFESKKEKFNSGLVIIERILYVIILSIIYTSIKFFYKYRTNVEFDNIYITDYFMHVDARLKNAKKPSLLPLSKYEKSMSVDVYSKTRIMEDKYSRMCTQLYDLALEMIPCTIFMLLDHLVVNLLRIIHKRSLITYRQGGEHEVRFRINGTGLMARLLRTTMKNFNIHERVSTCLSNEECLPVAHTLPSNFYVKLILLYLIIIVLIFSNKQMARPICSYFFPKREKQRILYLYSSMLRHRRTYKDELRRRAEANMATRHAAGTLNICLILRLSYPNTFGWLSRYSCAKRLCLICNARENDQFISCSVCGLPYCFECFKGLRQECIICGHEDAHDSKDSSMHQKKM